MEEKKVQQITETLTWRCSYPGSSWKEQAYPERVKNTLVSLTELAVVSSLGPYRAVLRLLDPNTRRSSPLHMSITLPAASSAVFGVGLGACAAPESKA
jgi:hypothetical protein